MHYYDKYNYTGELQKHKIQHLMQIVRLISEIREVYIHESIT